MLIGLEFVKKKRDEAFRLLPKRALLLLMLIFLYSARVK